jgi:hypothetical protein
MQNSKNWVFQGPSKPNFEGRRSYGLLAKSVGVKGCYRMAGHEASCRFAFRDLDLLEANCNKDISLKRFAKQLGFLQVPNRGSDAYVLGSAMAARLQELQDGGDICNPTVPP